MDKPHQLDKLKNQILKNPNLPFKETANNLVFGEGNSTPKVLFLGEAPGRFEDLSGRPFVGPAGKLLDKLLESIGLKRGDVFITSVLMYRPPKNRDPKPDEIESFKPYLDQLIKILDPEVIVTLGRFSLNKFLTDVKISKVHGKPQKINWQRKQITIVPIYHPAAALRSTKLKNTLFEDFKILSQYVFSKSNIS